MAWNHYNGMRRYKELKAHYQRQEYLSQRFREIHAAALQNGPKTYIYCRNTAQITTRIYNNKLREVVADFSSCGAERKLILDKTTYEIEFKSSDVVTICKALGLAIKQDSYGIYVEAIPEAIDLLENGEKDKN